MYILFMLLLIFIINNVNAPSLEKSWIYKITVMKTVNQGCQQAPLKG